MVWPFYRGLSVLISLTILLAASLLLRCLLVLVLVVSQVFGVSALQCHALLVITAAATSRLVV
jgi:hypothetical protein